MGFKTHPPDGSRRQGLPMGLLGKSISRASPDAENWRLVRCREAFPMPRPFTRTGGSVTGKRLSDRLRSDARRPLCDLCDFFVPRQQWLRRFFDPGCSFVQARFFDPLHFCAQSRFFGPLSFFSPGYGNDKKNAFGRIPSACPHDLPGRKKSCDSPLRTPLMGHFYVDLRCDDHFSTGCLTLEMNHLCM